MVSGVLPGPTSDWLNLVAAVLEDALCPMVSVKSLFFSEAATFTISLPEGVVQSGFAFGLGHLLLD